jgi:predicted nucleotidyltransferase
METKTRVAFDYDNEKAKLVKKSNLLEGSIEDDLEKIKDYFQENGQNALVIGGTLLGAYLLLRLLTSSGSDDHAQPSYTNHTSTQPVVHMVREEHDSELVKQIKTSISLFLISIAKQKLQEFIENYGKEKPKSE